jgi:hypothetical protein
MPNVLSVEWNADKINISMAVAHMTLFPNIKELRLSNVEFPGLDNLAMLLCARGKPRVLSLEDIEMGELDEDTKWELQEYLPFDLTGLENLTVTHYSECNYIGALMQRSRPTRLLSLSCDTAFDALHAMQPIFWARSSIFYKSSFGFFSQKWIR